MFMRLTD